METSRQGNLIGKGKLSGKKFWTWGKLLYYCKSLSKENLLGKQETFWKMGTPEQGNLLGKGKLSGKNLWTRGKI